MSDFFSVEYTDAPLQVFGAKHLSVVALFVLFWLSFIYFRKVWDGKDRNRVRLTLGILLAVNEFGLHIWSAYWGIWNIQTMLPLHMCSVMVWLTAYMTITRSYAIYEFAYFLGIGGALQALLTPADVALYDLPHYRSLQSLVAHGLLITIPVYMTVVEGFRPTLSSFKRIFIWTNIYMVVIFFVNQAIGSNYLFIAEKPPSPTLMDALSPWPWYIPQLELVAFAILFVLYIPFLIKDRFARSPEQVA